MADGIRQWGFRLAALAVMAASPLLGGTVFAVLLLLVMPLLVECSRVQGEQLSAACCAAGLALGCALTLPQQALYVALPWCAACALIPWTAVASPFRRGAVWSAVVTGALCAALALLGYQGPVADGLAWDAVHWISAQENCEALLVQAYQLGLARLDSTVAQTPAINLFGMLIMPEAVRQELLYSLRYTLSVALESLLPQWAVYWIGLTGLLCSVVPDVLRRRSGKQGLLPPAGLWRFTPRAHRLLTAALLWSLAAGLMEHSVARLTGSMCMALFHLAYTVLGLCVLEGLTKRLGMARTRRRIIAGIALVIAPFVPLMLGVTDRIFDFRTPRPAHDDDKDQGGYEK